MLPLPLIYLLFYYHLWTDCNTANIGNNNDQKLYFTDVNADGLCMCLQDCLSARPRETDPSSGGSPSGF